MARSKTSMTNPMSHSLPLAFVSVGGGGAVVGKGVLVEGASVGDVTFEVGGMTSGGADGVGAGTGGIADG